MGRLHRGILAKHAYAVKLRLRIELLGARTQSRHFKENSKYREFGKFYDASASLKVPKNRVGTWRIFARPIVL